MIEESCQTPHIIHWKEDDISDDMTKTNTKTKTKCLKDPSHAILLKSREFKDIKYDTNSDHKDKMTKKTQVLYFWKWYDSRISNDDGGWISDALLKVMHQGWGSRGDAPVVMHQKWCTMLVCWYTPTRVECFPDLVRNFWHQPENFDTYTACGACDKHEEDHR